MLRSADSAGFGPTFTRYLRAEAVRSITAESPLSLSVFLFFSFTSVVIPPVSNHNETLFLLYPKVPPA